MHMSRNKVVSHLVLGVIVLAAAAWAINYVGYRLIDIPRLREWVRGFGPWAPLVFVLVSALAHLVFLPVAPFTVAAIALFSWPVAAVSILVSHNLAANLGFWLPYVVGEERLARLWKCNPKVEAFDAKLRQRGFATVLLFRIVPGLPFSLVSYLSALSGIRWRDYALASFIGMLPGPITLAIVLSHS
jgi:uncharacterized membrane protein YdjX (TVP38/TMEM64 family)